MASGNAYPVDEAKLKALQETYLNQLQYDIIADPGGYWGLFSSFDVDSGGSISRDEFRSMISSLGMNMSPKELEKMVEEADADKSNEIEFGEFLEAVGSEKMAGSELARIIKRKKNSISLNWREDKIGEGVVIDKSTNSASYASSGQCAVVLLTPMLPMPPGEAEKRNKAEILFEIDAPSGDVWVGCVSNFSGGGDGAQWQQEFGDKSDKRKDLVGCRSSDGSIFRYGVTERITVPAFGKALKTVHLDISMDVNEMVVSILDPTNDNKPVAGEATIDNLKATFAVAVCFGPVPEGGEPSKVRLVGSSAEKVEKRERRSSKEMWDPDRVVTANEKPIGGSTAETFA